MSRDTCLCPSRFLALTLSRLKSSLQRSCSVPENKNSKLHHCYRGAAQSDTVRFSTLFQKYSNFISPRFYSTQKCPHTDLQPMQPHRFELNTTVTVRILFYKPKSLRFKGKTEAYEDSFRKRTPVFQKLFLQYLSCSRVCDHCLPCDFNFCFKLSDGLENK